MPVAVFAQRSQKLVIPGDFPDPSVIRVGDTYYSTCSASEWGPIFALAKSTDLVNWSIVKYAMPTRPKWSTSNYWAPELYHDGKKFFIYYTGRIEGGPLCVSVATADKAEGPWTDHGPVVCQTAGSIDASCIEDDKGQKYLIWKEDGNSVNKPTPIWGQQLSKSGITPIGEKFELFRNDTPWERNLVEGAYIIKKGEYFYCFYAGAGCCGAGCDYAIGVARSKSIKDGKWEKYGKNPILAGNDVWKCPGHGTVVSDTKGNDFLMYHAYSTESGVYVGRQALMSQITWTADGWPVIKDGADALGNADPSALNFTDDFTKLAASWRWPVEHQPTFKAANGLLALTAMPESNNNKTGAVLAQAALTHNYVATATVKVTPGVSSGLSAFGDINNAIGLSVSNGELLLWKVRRNQRSVIDRVKAPAAKALQFKITVQQGKNLQYAYSVDGKSWKNIGETQDGAYLPPWDRGVRIALVAQGKGTCYFDRFSLAKM
ncbi:family 43 glycosylhydrolase [Mucilaginibacter myungsuensis]|uniref:Family 43 glycosylhydrolase n=1 Tax=Mucilaginibacter myungsuensis TaxID=649104 RepID=A0A929KWY3_9SPHI|nr:family 43 glycosylhydrolase [Mucilaginibacter myungsuensis]MBE9660419.1 family 43 glycosylhydrolase [Mucilaginibacter myungsuensis]MDN3600461.1 family 43 glycosylhydrolase [Mucilaginibacter myungsuensis]